MKMMIMDSNSMNDFIRKIMERDRKIILKDASLKPIPESEDPEAEGEAEINPESPKIIADFTEYSPLHKGHRHCMRESKKQVPDGIFVAIVPGPTERSGRGLPYIMTRQARAQAAVDVGADIVVEGPPMGIMGSGQYSLCLAKMIKALDADYIPRGYQPVEGFELIMDRISQGHAVAPKPYKMVDMTTREILLEGKLQEDNYVIASLSKSLHKVGFNFKNKFIFVERIPGVSGTIIREAVLKKELNRAKDMLPPETIKVLQEEMENDRAPLHDKRDIDSILKTANESSEDELNTLALLDEKTVQKIVESRPFNDLEHLKKCISWGFSTHFQQRVLSSLEAKVDKETIYKYIENYPSLIRVLNYKDKHVLQEFKNRIPHRRIQYGS
jgi:predicted nucleotidyltransferase